MQFSVILEAQLADPTVEREHRLIHDCVERAVLAEEMGFAGPDGIAAMRRASDEVVCLVQMGTLPQEACPETLRQWGEKVVPHFRPRGREAA